MSGRGSGKPRVVKRERGDEDGERGGDGGGGVEGDEQRRSSRGTTSKRRIVATESGPVASDDAGFDTEDDTGAGGVEESKADPSTQALPSAAAGGARAGAGGDEDEFATEEETEDDADDDGPDDEFADEDDLVGANRLSSKRSEVGTVLEVCVKNFMCHRNLRVTFNKRLNFIVGRNGSGKSAVVAALQMCLGIRTKDTNRGGSTKSLICRDSSGDATLSVTLNNEGHDAYQPEKFGDKIKIERKLHRSGVSSYTLYDSAGKAVGHSKKHDLDPLLTAMNIQVDNPIVVMDQETMKLFSAGRPKDQYMLFLRATELKRTSEDIASAKVSADTMKTDLDITREKLKLQELELQAAKQLYDDMQKLHEIDDKIREARDNQIWAYFASKDRPVETLEKRIAKSTKAVEELRQQIESLQRDAAAKEDEEAQLQVQAANAASQSSALVEETKALIRQQAECTHREKSAQSRLASIHSDRRQIERKQRDAQQRMFDARNGKEEMERARLVADRDRRLTEARAAAEDAKQHADALEAPLREAEQKAVDAGHHARVAASEFNSVNGEMKRAQQRLQALRGRGKDPITACDKRLQAIVREVRSNPGQFSVPPVGPLLLEIKMKPGQERWAKAVETIAGPKLTSFLVASVEDGAKLRAISQRHKWSLRYVVQKPRTDRVSFPHPGRDLLPITDVVDIRNPWAFNYIVDSCKLDTTLLFEDIATAERTMFRQHGGRVEMLTRGQVGMDSDGRRVYSRGNGITNRKPTTTMAQYLVENVGDQLAEAEAAVRGIQAECTRAKAVLDEARKHERTAGSDASRLQREQTKHAQMHVRYCHQVDEISAEEIPETEEADFSGLEEELAECQQELSALSETENAISQELKTARDEKSELQAQKAALDRKKKEIDATEIIEAMEGVAKKKRKLYQRISDSQGKLAEHEKTIQQNKREIEQISAEMEDELRQVREATKLQENPCPGLSAKEADKQLKTLERLRVEEKKRFADKDPEVVRTEYETKKNAYTVLAEDYKRNSKARKALKKLTEQRQKRWNSTLSRTATNVSTAFNIKLSKKGHTGVVKYDHRSQTLHMDVNVDAQMRQQATQDEDPGTTDTGALSGGERSFVTLSLVTALGETIESPFRVVDEFDVFMDEQSRKAAMEMLIENARTTGDQHGTQFIYLTPHDVSPATELADYVSVFRMPTPRK